MSYQPLLFSGFVIGQSSGGGGGSPTIGGPVVGGTTGSVLFVGPGSTLAQDNANFDFNDTTHALTITGPISASNISGSNTGDVTLGTSNGLSLVGQVLSLGLSSTSTTGALSSTDWNIFNNKQPAFTSQSANLFFASPNGSSGVPTFRSIVAADLPSLSGTYVPQSEVGVANGVASLDGSGKIPVAQLPSVVMEYQGSWNPNTNTPTLVDGTGTNGFVYYVSAARLLPVAGLTDPSMVNFEIGDLVIYSASVGKYQLTTPAAGVSSVNGAQGGVIVNAINQLTGDVIAGPATQSQSQAATIEAIQGNSVTGTTGTGNVVFSASPTLTGTLNGSSAVFSSTISASNLSGTNTGDQTITLTGAVTGSGTGSFATTLTNSSVTGQLLTGFTPGPNSPIIATDSILSGLEKLQAQVSSSGSGTVTSVGFADTSTTPIYSITNSPVTIAGTIDQTLVVQSANTVFAGPTSGGSAQPTFRTLTNADVGGSPGDLSEMSFTAADNQSSPANITGFDFSNSIVRSFDATVSIIRGTTYAAYKIYGINKSSSWEMSSVYTGDITGITFSITNAGQVQYISSSTGFTALIKFRAITTSL
jgi:hypothetical protein